MLWLLATLAFGQADDLDVTWPNADCGGWGDLPGIGAGERTCVRAGTEYANRPAVSWRADGRREVHVEQRFRSRVGVSHLPSKGIALTATVPFVIHTAYGAGDRDRDVGLGDLVLGVHGRLFRERGASLRADLDVRLPTSPRDSWLGEPRLRVRPGIVFQAGSETHQVVVHGAAEARSSMDGDRYQALPVQPAEGTRVYGVLGWRARWSETVGTQVALVGRRTLSLSGQQLAPTEVRTALRLRDEAVAVDLHVGHGIVRGLGSTGARVGLSFTGFLGQEPGLDDPEVVASTDATQPDDTADDDLSDTRGPPPPMRDEPDIIAVVNAPAPSRDDDGEPPAALPSLLLDTLFFEAGQTALVAESEPVLGKLITDLRSRPDVGPILLEGHASDEGDTDANYTLSLRRADAIYRRLIAAGLSPTRLVLRPLGEVAPDTDAPDRRALRRVEVRLVLDPAFDDVRIHPFTGEEVSE